MLYAQQMIQLVLNCCESNPEPSDTLTGNVAGLIGDLVTLYGDKIVTYLQNDKVCFAQLYHMSNLGGQITQSWTP